MTNELDKLDTCHPVYVYLETVSNTLSLQDACSMSIAFQSLALMSLLSSTCSTSVYCEALSRLKANSLQCVVQVSVILHSMRQGLRTVDTGLSFRALLSPEVQG